MFIQTEALPDPNRYKFFPGEEVLESGTLEISDISDSELSPLAVRIFKVPGISSLTLYADCISITKTDSSDWQILKPMVLGAIMDHYSSGENILSEPNTGAMHEELEFNITDREEDSNIISEVNEIMTTRIKPAAEQMGGEIIFKGYRDGVVYVEFIGPTTALINGMTNVISHYVPEVSEVKDYRDAIVKPGLDTPIGRAIQELLVTKINPSVAGHGGHISLIDVRGDKAFIRLEGGCQGCGMADVTLKQGIEVEIKEAVPSIKAVLDVTDHAGGTNPYYTQ